MADSNIPPAAAKPPAVGGKKPSVVERFRAFLTDMEASEAPAGDPAEARQAARDEAVEEIKRDVQDIQNTVKDLARLVSDALGEMQREDGPPDESKTKDMPEVPGVTQSLPGETATLGKNPLTGDALRQFAGAMQALAPGQQYTTADAVGGVEAMQRRALLTAQGNAATAALVAPVLRGRDVRKLTGDALAAVFDGAAALVQSSVDSGLGKSPARHVADAAGGLQSPAQINAANRAMWAKKG